MKIDVIDMVSTTTISEVHTWNIERKDSLGGPEDMSLEVWTTQISFGCQTWVEGFHSEASWLGT